MGGGLADDVLMWINAQCYILGTIMSKVDLELGGKPLVAHESETDLGEKVQNDLKVDQQCCKAANEANRKLGMIKRGWFKNKTRAVMLPL